MKPFFSEIVGNRALCEHLFHEITEHRLSHAYILEGPAGTGKHLLAKQICAAISCERREEEQLPLPCLQCVSCKKILSGNSPDVIFINRKDKATLGVEAIRGLKQDVLIPPNDLPAKIYIIEEAHLMTPQAQNALLLTLEEPPSYVLFFLLCNSASSLLETVRSRAPTLRTSMLSEKEVSDYLKRKYPAAAQLAAKDPSAYAELLSAAGGRIGKAVELLEPKNLNALMEKRQSVREFLRLAGARRNSSAAIRLLNGFAQWKREELAERLGEILLGLRDLLLCKESDNFPLQFFSDREEASALAYDFTLQTLLQLCDALSSAAERIRANANVRLTLTELGKTCGML